MRRSILGLAFLASGCGSIPLPTSHQLATAISNSTINVNRGDEVLCTSVTNDGRDAEIIHTSDSWQGDRACRVARLVKESARSFLRCFLEIVGLPLLMVIPQIC